MGLLRHLQQRILTSGPMSVSQWMTECLTNPTYGYYTQSKTVFGSSGDFITSPEITPYFGRTLGLWCYSVWLQMGRPSPFDLIELGPGRGTLMKDILDGVPRDSLFCENAHVRLVEVSPFLRDLQKQTLEKSSFASLSWLDSVDELRLKPSSVCRPSIVIAHEFFDALPVAHFAYQPGKGWCEKLVDLHPNFFAEEKPSEKGSRSNLRFVWSPGPTLGLAIMMKTFSFLSFLQQRERKERVVSPPMMTSEKQKNNEGFEQFEVSPQSLGVMQILASRPETALLVIDYGDVESNRGNSLRGIRNHRFVSDVLEDPGQVDLSVDVNFQYLGEVALHTKVDKEDKSVTVFGPISQREFLLRMGFNVTMQRLSEASGVSSTSTSTTKKEDTYLQCMRRLLEDMGTIFKVMAVTNFTHKASNAGSNGYQPKPAGEIEGFPPPFFSGTKK